MAEIDERFVDYVRGRGAHQLGVAVLLTGDWHSAEDLVQANLVKLYRAWPRLPLDGDPDAYLRRIMVNTHRSWWRARDRQSRHPARCRIIRLSNAWLCESSGTVPPTSKPSITVPEAVAAAAGTPKFSASRTQRTGSRSP